MTHNAVDYSSVAPRYDRNAIRLQIPRDPHVERPGAAPLRVLDLACGTGNYLATQMRHYPGTAAVWHGVDASEGMLAVARAKVADCDFRVARAESLPFADAAFDYVVCQFAFHHFHDKRAALREIWRVLAPGGRLRMDNIAPDQSPDWWLYRYFPATRLIDKERFWTSGEVSAGLGSQGFTVQLRPRSVGKLPLVSMYAEAKNRETSQLVLLDDAAYQRGFAKLAADYERTPEASVDAGLILVEWTAVKHLA